jgi:lysophospholipase L1-like esterase
MSKVQRRSAIVLYCIAIWLVFDLIYSRFFHAWDVYLRRPDEIYHHGLIPNVAGDISWGPLRQKYYTNSLGFRDAAAREVPSKPSIRRIILIGDSFTEGVGMTFEESFAGRLAQAGGDRAQQTEVLNAGVMSYSPVIYFKKIKYLIEAGLQFDEIVVLPDLSDVTDEATQYFCIDDDPRYRALCGRPESTINEQRVPRGLQLYFVMTDRVRSLLERAIKRQLGGHRERALHRRSGWTFPDFDVGEDYAPLGVEGGIARALQNMQALADLVKARGIRLVVAVYPWPMQLEHNDRNSRHVQIWRDFCARNGVDFIDAFPAFFAEKDTDARWYDRLFIAGDVHYSAEGNRVLFRVLADRLLVEPAGDPREGRLQ